MCGHSGSLILGPICSAELVTSPTYRSGSPTEWRRRFRGWQIPTSQHGCSTSGTCCWRSGRKAAIWSRYIAERHRPMESDRFVDASADMLPMFRAPVAGIHARRRSPVTRESSCPTNLFRPVLPSLRRDSVPGAQHARPSPSCARPRPRFPTRTGAARPAAKSGVPLGSSQTAEDGARSARYAPRGPRGRSAALRAVIGSRLSRPCPGMDACVAWFLIDGAVARL